MKPLTLQEAAEFLRVSRSTLYQRDDIPRYRLPGSRSWIYDQEELEALLKHGRDGAPVGRLPVDAASDAAAGKPPVVYNSAKIVYHRSSRYR